MNIVLIGYRGTGKSTVAAVLAERLKRDVFSTDAEIIKRTGLAIPDFVAQYGWDRFRTLEAAICQELRDRDNLIIDTGGGIVLNPDNIQALKARGRVFWLTATVPTIAARIGSDTQRPSLTGTKSFLDEIEEVLAQRQSFYRAAADRVIPTDELSPERVADIIVAQLSSCDD